MDTVLAERVNTGLVVQLHYGNGNVAISVKDGEFSPLTFPVNPESALDAFYHPFAYMPKHDSDTLKAWQRMASQS